MHFKNFVFNDITRIFVLFSLLGIVLIMWTVPDSYATDKSGNVKWQLIFLSPYGGCTNYQYQKTDAYDEITSKYFALYEFENSKYSPQCMPDKKYSQYQIPKDLDLLILVYDNEIGKKELHSNSIGGLYNHVGTDRTKDHTIIICDCSNFGFSDPTWILSHELSHFITYYLGFDFSIVQNEIHSKDKKYDQCVESYRDNACSSVITRISGDHYFTNAVVMTPYPPAVGMKLISVQNGTVNETSNVIVNSVVMNMQKEITKWWIEGKVNDTEYAKVLGYVVGKSDGTLHDSLSSNVDFAGSSNATDTNTMINDFGPGMKKADNLPSNIIFADGSDGTEENTTINDLRINQYDSAILKRIPFKEENASDSHNQIIIPDWFKYKAYKWSQDQLWSDNDFVNGIKHLFDPQIKN